MFMGLDNSVDKHFVVCVQFHISRKPIQISFSSSTQILIRMTAPCGLNWLIDPDGNWRGLNPLPMGA